MCLSSSTKNWLLLKVQQKLKVTAVYDFAIVLVISLHQTWSLLVATNPTDPAISLVRVIFYLEVTKFSNAATRWGCQHEDAARDRYKLLIASNHEHFAIEQCGLLLNPTYPHLSASPVGLPPVRIIRVVPYFGHFVPSPGQTLSGTSNVPYFQHSDFFFIY